MRGFSFLEFDFFDRLLNPIDQLFFVHRMFVRLFDCFDEKKESSLDRRDKRAGTGIEVQVSVPVLVLADDVGKVRHIERINFLGKHVHQFACK